MAIEINHVMGNQINLYKLIKSINPGSMFLDHIKPYYNADKMTIFELELYLMDVALKFEKGSEWGLKRTTGNQVEFTFNSHSRGIQDTEKSKEYLKYLDDLIKTKYLQEINSIIDSVKSEISK